MATMLTNCPQCKKQIKVPAEVAGKKIKCKGCGTVFVAKATDATSFRPADAPGAKPPPPVPAPTGGKAHKPVDDDDDGDGKPYGVTDLDLAPRCPHCAHEFESEDQVVCLNCGYNTQTRELGRRKRVKDPTGMDWFMWLLPAGLNVLCFLICLAELTNITIRFFVTDRSDYEQLERTAYNCGALWGSVFCIWCMYWSGKNAFKRLVFNFRPPEEEIH